MSVSDEFQAALMAGNFQQAFALAVSKALELNVNTAIVEDDNSTAKGLTTKINLIEGEISNKIDANVVDSEFYQTLQQFHQQQIERGNETLLKQLESLQKMLRLMAIMQQQYSADSTAGKLIDVAAEDVASKSLASETKTFLPNSQTNPTQETETEDDELLALNDLELDDEDDELMTLADVSAPTESAEDWGDWIEQTNNDESDTQVGVEPSSQSDWENDDWEEEQLNSIDYPTKSPN